MNFSIGNVTEIVPEDESPIPLTCNVDGCENPVIPRAPGSRGRNPTKCPDHKNAKTVSNTRSNSTNAKQAAAILTQMNAVIGFGMFMTGFTETHDAISTANESFTERAISALESNPKLCKTILQLGAHGGEIALFVLYAQMGIVVGPTFIMEMKSKKEAKEAGEDTM